MHESTLFPHHAMRQHQDRLVSLIQETVQRGGQLIVHAPTGLGKTASALGPALKEAFDQNKTVIYLTSRHTQHEIALETLQAIQDIFGRDFHALSVIGKKHLCLQPNIHALTSREFQEYCKALVMDERCSFYSNVRKGDRASVPARLVLDRLKGKVVESRSIIQAAEENQLCPYELALLSAKNAKVIVTDYFYLFNPHIRETFLRKIDKPLNDIIIVVDEAHNLPNRVKDLASEYLTTRMLSRALKEVQKHGYDELTHIIKGLAEYLKREAETFQEMKLNGSGHAGKFDEKYITQEAFLEEVARLGPVDRIVEQFIAAGDAIREEQRQSFVGSIGMFLAAWQGGDEGYTRILSLRDGRQGKTTVLSYRCLDPSIITKHVLEGSHASILMSGTLAPTDMYADLLGIPEARQEELTSPFPEDNKLTLIIPKTTTKFKERNPAQYQNIAQILAEITDAIPGNSAAFFPSYYLLNQVYNYFQTLNKRTILTEQQGMSKEDKAAMLDKLRKHSKNGAILLAVSNGSFGEGIDLPGDELKGVVVVGLPLTKPDLETEALVNYYQEKFERGYEYGYLFPAFQRVWQNMGRLIRSEKDKGVIALLDERFGWDRYHRLFRHEHPRISLLFRKMIQNFFAQ